MKARDDKALKRDDLWAENFALQNVKLDVTNTLFNIEQVKQQLISAIYNKNLEKSWRTNQMASTLSEVIVKHPEDTITHLYGTFGNLVTHDLDAGETVHNQEVFDPDCKDSSYSSI